MSSVVCSSALLRIRIPAYKLASYTVTARWRSTGSLCLCPQSIVGILKGGVVQRTRLRGLEEVVWGPLAHYMRTKFEVLSFSCFADRKGSQNLKVRHVTPPPNHLT